MPVERGTVCCRPHGGLGEVGVPHRGLDRLHPSAPVAGGLPPRPTSGPLFLVDAIAGFALAAGGLAWPL